MSETPRPTGTRSPELSRLRTEAACHRRLRDITLAFSTDVSSGLRLPHALSVLTFDINSLFGARRSAVWLHQRRARELALTASSDDRAGAPAGRVATEDLEAPPARGLRLDRPEMIDAGGSVLLLAPLRGWRRALGTLVIDGPFDDGLDRALLVDLAHELSRQLSPAIENLQLLEDLLRQRRLLEDTFDSLIDLVVVTDKALRVVQMNEAFVTRIGLPRGDLLERPLETLVDPELAGWATSAERADDAARTERFDDARLGGTFAVTMTALVSDRGEVAGHVLVARDITHQTRLEHDREALRERLGQSEKLAALGQFVAGIAHEMNNPLQGVLGHLELLMQTSEAARPIRRELRRIYQEADRAAKIVRNLLAFTGSRPVPKRRVKLGQVLTRVIASRMPALEREGIEVIRDISPDLPAITGDGLQLHQAFLNVLINAEHANLATGQAGRIEIRAASDPAGPRLLTTIRDTGPGIPPDVLPRIFDPFFTTKDVGQGTGLGLAITYGIIQDHGGAITAANAPGGGAIFTIELPASPAG
jgi:two-component system NtrC family sensor kinase